MPVPFVRAAIGVAGKPFDCKACKRLIVIPKLSPLLGGVLGVVGLLAVKVVGLIAILPLALGIGVASWLLIPVRLVEPSNASREAAD